MCRIALLSLILIAASTAFGGVPLAVKRGQTEVAPQALPFVCIAVVTEGIRSPIEKIVFREVATNKTYTAGLGKTFDPGHPDYFVALDGQQRLAALLILKLGAGEYDVQSIEFTPLRVSGTASLTVNYSSTDHRRFTVKPGAVNYVGSLVITAPTGQGGMPLPGASRSFLVEHSVEQTQERDRNWAIQMVPVMANLPAVTGELASPEKQAIPPAVADGPDVAAVAIERKLPQYSDAARAQGLSGEVILQMQVETDGSVGEVDVVRSSHPMLDAAAVAAARGWRFKPAYKAGNPVTTHVQVPFTFTLADKTTGADGEGADPRGR